MDAILTALAPLSAHIATLDLTQANAARASLDALPAALTEAATAALLAAHEAGTLTPRDGGPGVRFGRIAKASPATSGNSLDAVDIAGAGVAHTHPKGEVSWCIPLEGAPVFEGVASGWAVLAAGSAHTPTVTGGRMLIVYWLPDGAVTWT